MMAAPYHRSDYSLDAEGPVAGLVSSSAISLPAIGSVDLLHCRFPAVQLQQEHHFQQQQQQQPRLLPPTAYCLPDGDDYTAPMSTRPTKRLRSDVSLSEPHPSKKMRVDTQYSFRSSQPAVHAPVTTHSKVCHVNHIALDTNQSPSEPTYRGPDAFDVERRLEHAQRLPADVTCEAPPYVLPLGSDMYRQHHTGTNAPSSALVADDWIATQTHAVFQPLPTYIPTDNEGGFAAWPQLDPRNHHPYNTYTPVGLSPTPLEGPTKSNQLGSGLQPAPVTERPWAQSFVNDHNSMAPSSNTQTSVPIQYPSTYFNRNDSLGPHNLLQTQIADGFESEAGHLELHETQRQTQRNIKRRSAFKPEQRDETRKTRRLKACIRCHMQKIRCGRDPQDENGPCLTCQGVTGPTLSGQPCFRMKISDVIIYNYTPHPPFKWSRRWESMKMDEVTTWSSPDIKTIKVTQDIGGTAYNLRVRQFVNQDGDAILRTWRSNGKKKCYTCTKWAIEDMKNTGEELVEFVDENMAASIEHFIDETDTLLHSTYAMAYRYSQVAENEEERTLLKHVLRLWVACRLNSASERICGEETLGMQPQDFDPLAKNFGMILTPPIIAAQLTVIITVSLLLPMKHAVLQGLQRLLEANKARYWFTIYLTMFILLHSCAMFTAFEQKQSLKHGLTARYENPSQVEELHNSAKIMLAYFHYCSKGDSAFHSDWRASKNALLADLNKEQVDFLQGAAEQVEMRRTKFDDIKLSGHFENDYFFLAQLYDKDWRPVPTI